MKSFVLAAALASVASLSACTTMACTFENPRGSKSDGAAEACMEAAHARSARSSARADADAQSADADRAERARVAPACADGDPHACLTVAVYDERHAAPANQIARAYGIACDGQLAYGCYGAARFTADSDRAHTLYERGCRLGEQAACSAIGTSGPHQPVDPY